MHPSNGTYLNRAKFIGLKTNSSYNFRIYSANKNGLSANHVSLFVTKESDGKYLHGIMIETTHVLTVRIITV